MRFLVDYANIEGFEPTLADLDGGPPVERALDRWLVARTDELVREATDAYEAMLTTNVIRAFDAFVDDLSNWYIRRSRRRFYSYDDAAFRTLWYALVQSLRVVSPVMPFLTEQLWRNLVAVGAVVDLPRGLAGARRARPRAARRDRRGAARRRARPSGARDVGAEAPAAAPAARRRRRGRGPRRTRTRSPTSCA